jgi:hypothetical protein
MQHENHWDETIQNENEFNNRDESCMTETLVTDDKTYCCVYSVFMYQPAQNRTEASDRS